ncbi:MAG TPA: undecaprenyl-diphosphate phosphatase [Candidatus Hodarchaeales archaeon]|nr:undecaprenyl-diphosphate phosphatase [Candidatus Hodarchaeales archaeon]
MIDLLKIILLGIIQGITEFLPISSTGHLIVATQILDYQVLGATFEIFIQLGSVIAVVFYYAHDLVAQAKAIPKDSRVRNFWLYLGLAFIPAGAVGLFFGDWLEATLFNPQVVATSLIVGGFIFLVIERLPLTEMKTEDLLAVSFKQSMGVGLCQTLALIPGVSRSGASIVGGLLVGMNRQTATRFSFYLAIPTLGMATIYSLTKSFATLSGSDFFALGLGALTAGITSWLVLGWLLRYISAHNFTVFGWYRIAAGLTILSLTLIGFL